MDGFKISAEESAISEQMFNEKANVLVVAKNGLREIDKTLYHIRTTSKHPQNILRIRRSNPKLHKINKVNEI